MLPVLEKQPGEKKLLDGDFSRQLRPGVALASVDQVTIATLSRQPDSADDDVPLGSTAVSGTVAQVWCNEGGTDRERYKVTFFCTDSLGQKLEAEGILLVKET